MRILMLSLMMIPTVVSAGGLGGGDICAIRPDLCDNEDSSVAVLAAQAQARRPAGARRAPRAPSPSASITCRPAHIAVTAGNANIPVCGSRGPASVASVSAARVSVSFDSYMNANAANPDLTRRTKGYQTAFRDTAKPATFVAPNLEGAGVREGAEPAGAARNN